MTQVRYVRLYADASGESHFADEEAALREVDFAPPAPPLHLWAFTLLAGEVEGQASDGEARRFGPGSILLMEDTAVVAASTPSIHPGTG